MIYFKRKYKLLIILSLYREEIIIEYNMLKSMPPIKKYFATFSFFLKFNISSKGTRSRIEYLIIES